MSLGSAGSLPAVFGSLPKTTSSEGCRRLQAGKLRSPELNHRHSLASQESQQLPILHFVNGISYDFIAPRHRRSRNQLLRVRRQIIEQRVAAFGIELTKNIVNQKQWRFPLVRTFQHI